MKILARLMSTRPTFTQLTSARFAREVKECLVLALPLAAAQLAQTATGFVDTLMMGWLGSDTLAAGGLGAAVFNALLLMCGAIVSAVSPLIAEAYGAGRSKQIGPIARQGLWLAALLSVPLMLLVWNSSGWLRLLGQEPATIARTQTYLQAIVWGYLPGLGFAVLRSVVAALSKPRPIIAIVVVGTLINVFFNDALMFGKYGLPELGLAGIGWASALSLWSMFLALSGYILLEPTLQPYRLFQQMGQLDARIWSELLRVGLPIGGLVAVEAGLFTVTTFLMGQLGTVSLAAHQIALQTAATTFTVSLGISLATTVRVGQHIGQNDRDQARLAGLIGIGLGGAFMGAMGLVFWLAPTAIVSLYLDVTQPANAAVVELTKRLLVVAAVFQLVDGIQVCAAGALRGLKDTQVPMLIGFVSYWCIGLTSGCWLGLQQGGGGVGLWWGLAIGLIVAACVLTWRFVHHPQFRIAIKS